MTLKQCNEMDELEYISETCFMCGAELTRTIDIMITLDSDEYVCIDCCKYHGISAVRCREIGVDNIS